MGMGGAQGKTALPAEADDVALMPHVLCMAGAETTAVVQQVAASAQLTVRPVATTAEALQLLEEQRRRLGGATTSAGGCRALVAALGVDASNFLFNEGYGDKSDLISLAKQLGCGVVVYSHTAAREKDFSRACMDVGADAVVASAADLQQQLPSDGRCGITHARVRGRHRLAAERT